MRTSTENPAAVGAGRASEVFCSAAERPEDSRTHPSLQARAAVDAGALAQDELVWSPADLRLADGGLGEREMELLDCELVASHEAMHSRLWALGVRRTAGLHFESIVFLPGDRFEFARDVRDASGAVVAVVFAAPDDLGQLLDLAAWDPDSGRLALLLGRVAMLGQDSIYGWRLGEPLAMHETPLQWLQSNREGVFVIDPQRASPLLRMVEPLGVRCASFGHRMRAAMTLRAPRIVVAENRRVAA
jgi:hypothetical protein